MNRLPTRSRISPGTYAAVMVIALTCVAGLAYLGFADRSTRWPSVSVESENPLSRPPDVSTEVPSDAQQADRAIAALIDRVEAAIARGSFESGPDGGVLTMLERISALVRSASPEGRKLATAMPGRLAASALAAAAAGKIDVARRLDQFSRMLTDAPVDYTGAIGPAPSLGTPSMRIDPSTRSPQTPPPPSDNTDTASVGLEAATSADRKSARLDVASPAVRGAGPQQHIDPTEPAGMAMPAPQAVDRPSAELSTLAPLRVVLTVVRNDAGRARRAEEIRRALQADGIAIARLVTVDARPKRPIVGYYFRSDRDAAVGVIGLLRDYLAPQEPALLHVHGDVPQPGTIEIGVP